MTKGRNGHGFGFEVKPKLMIGKKKPRKDIGYHPGLKRSYYAESL
jgi:hypothetical protein